MSDHYEFPELKGLARIREEHFHVWRRASHVMQYLAFQRDRMCAQRWHR